MLWEDMVVVQEAEEAAEAVPEAVAVQEAAVPESKLRRHLLEVVTIVLIMTGEDDITRTIQIVQASERREVGILVLYLH